MKSVRKLFRDVHLWLSVPFGIILMIVCFTGALLVFEKELTELFRPSLYRVEAAGEPMDVGQIAAMVQSTLPDDVEVTGVTVYSSPSKAWRVSLSKPRHAAVMVNPYTGEQLGSGSRLPFFSTVFRLHRWLMGSRPDEGIFWGKMVVGVSVLAFVFVLISGVVIWWPRTVKALRANLKVSLRHGWFRFCRSLHVAGGIYVFVFLFAAAVTGLTWSFQWWRTGFYALFGAGGQPAGHAPQPSPQGESGELGGKFVVWQQALDAVAQQRGGIKSNITVGNGRVTVPAGSYGNVRASDAYMFDAATGELGEVQLYAGKDRPSKMRGWVYSVHTGAFGGVATRVLMFLAALLGATLPLTGYYIWIRRLLRTKK